MCIIFTIFTNMCIIFLIFTSDHKQVVEVNFKGVVQIIYNNESSRKSFPIYRWTMVFTELVLYLVFI